MLASHTLPQKQQRTFEGEEQSWSVDCLRGSLPTHSFLLHPICVCPSHGCSRLLAVVRYLWFVTRDQKHLLFWSRLGLNPFRSPDFTAYFFFSFLLLIILSKSSNPLGSEMKSGHGSNDMAVTTPFTRLHSQMETIVFSESEGWSHSLVSLIQTVIL